MSDSGTAGKIGTGALGALAAGYRIDPAVYDELLDADGTIRPMWQPVIAAFERMSDAERKSARTALLRMLSENRVTFVSESDAGATHQPWQLDLLPLLISPSEWASLERGLIQRARVLDAALADLYGRQKALHEGQLPPSVVFANPRYLRPCANLPMRGGTHLHFIAFDCARSPDGQWWILSDRTEAPSGAGYALENRITTSRVLPELFAGQNVRRHAGFFRDFSDYFLGLAARDEPLAVCLSRGPTQRSYFEHSYLARYLGYSVVEGSDLAVRDDRLFLKTVEGLRPVDLLLRTVRSDLCDPLELRSESMVGIPGLLQAARAGKVTIGNALGSGLVESDAFLSFLPALCRYYLGEELQLPSIATWWCGQEKELRYVIEHLDELNVLRISTENSVLAGEYDLSVGATLSSSDRDGLIERLKMAGADFVGQEALRLSTAPVWATGGLQPAPVLLRMFVAATEDGYAVLPGGLARVAVDSDPAAAWLSAGEVSKDIWVLSDEPVETFSLLAQRQDAVWLRRGTRDLPSRVADNLFWLGRYAERAEAAVRLLRSLVVRLHGEAAMGHSDVPMERIVAGLVSQKYLSARRGRRVIQLGRDALEEELWAIIFEAESNDGLAAVIANVRRTADAVRERLSGDAFSVLMNLADLPRRNSGRTTGNEFGKALEVLNRLIRYLAAFSGMVMENMTRGVGWRFLDMGRRIERVRSLSQLTQQLTARGDPRSDGTLDLLLELADSTMTYLGRYHAQAQLARVLDLLLVDETNPRSVAFQMATIEEHLSQLARSTSDGLLGPDLRITTELLSRLRLADVVELSDSISRFGTRILLDRLCRDTEKGVDSLSDHVTRQYFSHSAPRRVVSYDRRREPR